MVVQRNRETDDNDYGGDKHADLVLQKQFDHLKVLIVNAHEQGGPDEDVVLPLENISFFYIFVAAPRGCKGMCLLD